MNRMTSIGESGLRSTQFWLDTLAHNIANVSTPGFRREEASFEAVFASQLQQGSLPLLILGNGVSPEDAGISHEQGVLQATGRMLDLAIEGPGFFTLQGPGGGTEFTRNGTFYLDGEGRLVAEDGAFVLGKRGAPITLGVEPGPILVNAAGEIRRQGSAEVLATLKLVNFKNPTKLQRIGAQRFAETDESGPPTSASESHQLGQVRQGYRELSNVNLAAELTQLIMAQRAFQLAARLVAEGDKVDSLAAELTR